VVRARKEGRRTGSYIRFDENAVVRSTTTSSEPRGFSVLVRERRERALIKSTALAPDVI
jgi:ribosomal protein L14